MIYLVLAHQAPNQLKKLLERLQDTNNHFVIHVDKNYDLEPFRETLSNIRNCHFIPERFSSHWGTFALIEATLEALHYVMTTLALRQRIVLISTADYPIKDKVYINKYLDNHEQTIFIEYEAIPRKIWYNGGIGRFPLFNDIQKQIKLYGGSQWFSIPFQVIPIIFDFLENNPDFITYFKSVKIPDESFFQTLLLNCNHPFVLKHLKNENLHFIKWDVPYMHPRILTMSDFTAIKKSKSLFARKVDLRLSDQLIRALDRMPPYDTSKTKPCKEAIIFLTSNSQKESHSRYDKLKQDIKYASVFKVVTSKSFFENADDAMLYEHHMCREMGYTPFNEDRIIPGCTYFALLFFKKRYPNYDNYWLIEDDVHYNGNWEDFFNCFVRNDADLISTYITKYQEAPDWYWWNTLYTKVPIPDVYKIRTFYPVCRFSNRALNLLDKQLKGGAHGHGEVLVPTLLHLHGLSLYDLTDADPVVLVPSADKALSITGNGTFRYRPIISPNEIKGKYLFHPVKDAVT